MFERVKSSLGILFISQLLALKSISFYRADFLFSIFINVAYLSMRVFFIAILYQISSGIPGWSYWQLILLIAISGVANSIVNYFININRLFDMLRNGGFTNYMIKPHNPLALVMARNGDPLSVTSLAINTAFTVWVAGHLSFQLPAAVAVAVLLIIGSLAMVLFMLVVIFAIYEHTNRSTPIWLIRSIMRDFGRYPLTTYGLVGTLVFTVLMPVGLSIYYPAAALVGKLDLTGFVAIFAVSAAIIYILDRILNVQIRSYTGAMS